MKFDDCRTCRFRRKTHICRDCDVGELYEDEDAPTVDVAFQETPTRFGETVISDEPERPFDPNRFVETIDTEDEPDEDHDS